MTGSGTTPEGPSAAHDARVLEAARAAGARIRDRRRPGLSWGVPLALAAGLAVGLLVPALLQRKAEPVPAVLTVPVGVVTRGGAPAKEIPVEQAPADAWYQYIQQLLAAGEIAEAERHLHRFVELHPDYHPPPR